MLHPAAGAVSGAQFALAIPRADGAARAVRHTDLATLCADEARLWLGDGTAEIELGRCGVAVGLLFTREGKRCTTVELDPAARPKEAARMLLARHWGAYAAILHDEAGETTILVDPSGLLPVYAFASPTHMLLTSHARLLGPWLAGPMPIDWRAVHDFLCRPDLRQRETCLAGVQELSPGALVSIRRGVLSEQLLWRPDAFMPGEPLPSFEQAAVRLRGAAVTVLGAWASVLGPVAVAASGGVDSSFLCGALHRAGAAFSCVTLATSDPSGDERAAVRRMADHLAIPLWEGAYDPGSFDPSASASSALPRPARKSFLTGVDRLFAAAAQELGASVVLDGNGGDNLFCYLHSAAPIVDRLRAEGLLSNWPGTLLDACRVTGCDLREMAGATWRRRRRDARFPAWPGDDRLLAWPAPAFDSADPLTPWTATAVGRHGGKHDHLALIMRAQNHLHGLAAAVPRFSPLMSQPLLELCLRIPTWLWCKGGLNRSLARQAFAAELPNSILTRTVKAGPDSYIRALFARNREAIGEALIEGVLMREGLLDRSALERALAIDAWSDGSLVYRLLDLAEAEHWARSWRT